MIFGKDSQWNICSMCLLFRSTTHCRQRLYSPMPWSLKRCDSARHTAWSAASSTVLNVLSWQSRSCMVKWYNPLVLNPGYWSHMSGSMKATFSRRGYSMVFRAVCDGAPSCCRVHLPQFAVMSGKQSLSEDTSAVIAAFNGDNGYVTKVFKFSQYL